MNRIGIDIGYGQTKIDYNGKQHKFPTAIAFFKDNGISFGNRNVYEFEGDKYIVGSEAESLDSFSTTDFNILYKFAPLIIYHILSKFDKVNLDKPIEIRTGLSLNDWGEKDKFIERIREFEVNGQKIQTNPVLIPQGVGIYRLFISKNPDAKNSLVSVIDIGNNTINLIHYEEGKPRPDKSKAYPRHGVSSIIKPFRSYLENKFKVNFSEQEAMKIMMKGKFTFNGKKQDDVEEYIKNAKKQFIKDIFNSVLVDDKKTLGISDYVVISGGGAYLLENSKFPDNVVFMKDVPYEFQNVVGYNL